MHKCDADKLTALCGNAKGIYLVGTAPVQVKAFAGKFVSELHSSDTVIVNSTDVATVVNLLTRITRDCTIMILDCSAPSTLVAVQSVLDKNIKRFQYSRQMLVGTVREKSLLIRHSTTKKFKGRSEEITIFLVLKSGGPVYDGRYVNATASNIRACLRHKHEIVCITDDSTGISAVDRVVKMRHNWPKWWGKVELFRSDITKNSHCLFMDLDTVCVDSIDYLCSASGGFYGLRDFYNIQTFQTGVLKWDVSAETDKIYNSFASADISKYMDKGDHEWIGSVASDKHFLQDTFPGEICSYKKHLPHIHKKFVSPSVICFHGDPRPHTVKDKFITDVWKYK